MTACQCQFQPTRFAVDSAEFFAIIYIKMHKAGIIGSRRNCIRAGELAHDCLAKEFSVMSLGAGTKVLLKPRSVFTNRNFLLLFSGKLISQLWDYIYAFALSWYILDLTKSSLQMAAFLVISTLVVAVSAPLGGIVADRYNRKGIMVWMDVLRGIVVIAAAFLLSQHMLQIWMLYLSAIILGFCGAMFSPAAGAIIPNIVEENQLTQALSANQFTASFCTMTGMVISGLLYNLIGISIIFVLNAASYFISGVLEACVRISFIRRDSAWPPSVSGRSP